MCVYFGNLSWIYLRPVNCVPLYISVLWIVSRYISPPCELCPAIYLPPCELCPAIYLPPVNCVPLFISPLWIVSRYISPSCELCPAIYLPPVNCVPLYISPLWIVSRYISAPCELCPAVMTVVCQSLVPQANLRSILILRRKVEWLSLLFLSWQPPGVPWPPHSRHF